MSSPIILSRTPFRLSLGGGSTDLPSYYEKHGGFIFAVTINLYMDVLIKATRSDDLINVHYKSFEITQMLGLPDGVQDPYVCAHGGFVLLDIEKDGKVRVRKPHVSADAIRQFFGNSLFFYTGVARESRHILAEQDAGKILELKHRTKAIGQDIYRAFQKGKLGEFGELMDEHWKVKKAMSARMTSSLFDDIYDAARRAGALGGKILGAGGGGYFIFYCPSEKKKQAVRHALEKFRMREMHFSLDARGARTKVVVP